MPKTTKQFIEEARKIHGDKYDYSLAEYKGDREKVTIICPIHGKFEQDPYFHIKGHDCPICAKEKSAKSNRMTQEEFVKKAKEKFGDKFDYSKAVYVNTRTPLKIICPIHGEFEITPGSFFNYKYGCPKCGKENCHKAVNNRKMTTKEFIKEAEKIHGDKYDYSLTNFINLTKKVTIICSTHGAFDQVARSHLGGAGCPECAKHFGNRKKPVEKVIEDFKKIHGDKYDYSLVEYKNTNTKVKIICPVHGVFEIAPRAHIDGEGCAKCATDKSKMSKEDFLKKAKEKFGNKFDFSKMEYKGMDVPAKFVCPVHGEFEKTPRLFIDSKYGCSECAFTYTPNTEEFVEKLKKVHGDKYDYSLVNYKNAHSKIKIICPVHGVFEQVAYYHLQGAGCPKCKNSKLEMFTESVLREYNIKYEAQKKFEGCEGKSNYKLPFDFYLPDYNVVIECQGQQHYSPVKFFGGEESFKNQVRHDNIKREFCKNNGIKEIEIKYNQDPLTVLQENSIIK